MLVDHGSPLPLYAQIESAIASGIVDGSLPPGSQLPTEDGLIERFQVSRPTIRKAVQNLASRGLVEIHRGKGTFITRPKIAQQMTALTGFVEDMEGLGKSASARVVDKQIVAASRTVAEHLALGASTLVVRIQRVRSADGVPVSFDETYLPLEIGQKVMTDNLETEPIFSLLEQKYNIPLVEAEYRLEAGSAEPLIAESLGVATGSPLFLIERTSYTEGNQPVDYERLYYRGDLIRFVTRLARRLVPPKDSEAR